MKEPAQAATPRKPGKARLPRLRTFASLKHRNYRFLWASTLFSSAGAWIQQVTLGWLIYEMTGSPFLVGALGAMQAFPFLVLGPITGVLTDRMDRRKLLIANQVFLAILALGISALVSSGKVQVWHLFAFNVLTGAGFSINNPLRQALVANTVPRGDLTNAMALSSMAFNINRVIGPAVGGVLIVFFGPATNFLIQGLCYVGVVLMVLPIRIVQQSSIRAPTTTPFSDLREGFSYVVSEKTTRNLILIATIPSLFIMPFISGLMPVFSKDVLGGGPDILGVLLATFGIGGLLGALTLASIGGGKSHALLQFGSGVAAGLTLLAVSRATSLAIALPLIAAGGAAHMLFNTVNNTALQTITPDNLRGRVMSIYMLSYGVAPLGSFLAGAIAHSYGTPAAMLVGGTVATGLICLAGATLKFGTWTR